MMLHNQVLWPTKYRFTSLHVCVLLPRTSINAPCHFFMQFLHLHPSIFPSTQTDVYRCTHRCTMISPHRNVNDHHHHHHVLDQVTNETLSARSSDPRLTCSELIENKRLDCTTIRPYRGQKIFDTSHDWLHDYFSLHCCCLFLYPGPTIVWCQSG